MLGCAGLPVNPWCNKFSHSRNRPHSDLTQRLISFHCTHACTYHHLHHLRVPLMHTHTTIYAHTHTISCVHVPTLAPFQDFTCMNKVHSIARMHMCHKLVGVLVLLELRFVSTISVDARMEDVKTAHTQASAYHVPCQLSFCMHLPPSPSCTNVTELLVCRRCPNFVWDCNRAGLASLLATLQVHGMTYMDAVLWLFEVHGAILFGLRLNMEDLEEAERWERVLVKRRFKSTWVRRHFKS